MIHCEIIIMWVLLTALLVGVQATIFYELMTISSASDHPLITTDDGSVICNTDQYLTIYNRNITKFENQQQLIQVTSSSTWDVSRGGAVLLLTKGDQLYLYNKNISRMYNLILSERFLEMGTMKARISKDASLIALYSSSNEVVELKNFNSNRLTDNQTLAFYSPEDVHIHKDNHYILLKSQTQVKLYRYLNSGFSEKNAILLEDGKCSIFVSGNFQFLVLTFSQVGRVDIYQLDATSEQYGFKISHNISGAYHAFVGIERTILITATTQVIIIYSNFTGDLVQEQVIPVVRSSGQTLISPTGKYLLLQQGQNLLLYYRCSQGCAECDDSGCLECIAQEHYVPAGSGCKCDEQNQYFSNSTSRACESCSVINCFKCSQLQACSICYAFYEVGNTGSCCFIFQTCHPSFWIVGLSIGFVSVIVLSIVLIGLLSICFKDSSFSNLSNRIRPKIEEDQKSEHKIMAE